MDRALVFVKKSDRDKGETLVPEGKTVYIYRNPPEQLTTTEPEEFQGSTKVPYGSLDELNDGDPTLREHMDKITSSEADWSQGSDGSLYNGNLHLDDVATFEELLKSSGDDRSKDFVEYHVVELD